MNIQYFRFLLLFPILLFFSASLLAQPAIGEWRAHISYANITAVTGSANTIYASSGAGIQLFHKNENIVEELNSVNGLNDIDITNIQYVSDIEALVIGYANGNLDVLQNETISNYPQIRDNPYYNNKKINDIIYYGNKILVAGDFGIVEFLPSSGQFKDSYYVTAGEVVSINDIALNDQFIFVATEQGVYYADRLKSLANPGSWLRVTALPNHMQEFNKVEVFNGALIANFSNPAGDDRLYVLENMSNSSLLTGDAGEVYNLAHNSDHLYVALSNEVRIYNRSFSQTGSISDYPFGRAAPRDVYVSPDMSLWFGDENYGLVRKKPGGQVESILRNGPGRNTVFSMSSKNGWIYSSAGGYDNNFNSLGNAGMFSMFKEGTWTNVQEEGVYDFSDIAVNKDDPSAIFIGSWSNGLFKFENGESQSQFNPGNSPLVSVNGETKVHQLARDSKGNLLMLNHGAEYPLVMKMKDDEWVVFRYEVLKGKTIRKLIWAKNGYVWGCFENSATVFIADFNGTLDNIEDDRIRVMQPRDHNSKTYAEKIFTIEEDIEENIWIATDEGVAVEYDPHFIFEQNILQPNRIRITENGFTQYMLRDNRILDVYTDPANRKWFATEKAGVMLFSAGGENLVSHFTTDNSPLLSDEVQTITMDTKSGEIFFGTSKGLVSYRSETAEGKSDFSQTYVFPNPVKPGYEGPITITGLIHGVNVKITDLNGNLVYETVAEGGQAIWRGNTLNGRKVSTGVYLVFITNEDGSKTHIEKILFIK